MFMKWHEQALNLLDTVQDDKTFIYNIRRINMYKNTYNLEKRHNLKIEYLKIQLEQLWLCFYHSLKIKF